MKCVRFGGLWTEQAQRVTRPVYRNCFQWEVRLVKSTSVEIKMSVETFKKMTDSGFTPMTKEIWDKILQHYLITYRGPNDEENIRRELDGFFVLTKAGQVGNGRFVRYMRKGILDNDLRRGGYVKRCTQNTIVLQDGRREWRVSRLENYIFVSTNEKSNTRLYFEKLLQRHSENERLAQLYDQEGDDENEDEEDEDVRAPTVKVNFVV